MTEGAKCAWKAHYKDGKLVNEVDLLFLLFVRIQDKDGSSPGKPVPSAGVKGTTITVRQTFSCRSN